MRKISILLATVGFLAADTTAFAAQSDDGGAAVGFLIIAGLIAIYFLPTIIGTKRGIASNFALFMVNLFTGWTVVGWFACLIWAAAGATEAQDEFYRRASGK